MATSGGPGSLQDIARAHISIQSQGTGGNTKFKCRHCDKIFTGSVTRQIAHLRGKSGTGVAICEKIDYDTRNTIQLQLARLERVKTGSQASSSSVGRASASGTLSCYISVPAGSLM